LTGVTGVTGQADPRLLRPGSAGGRTRRSRL